MQSATALQVHCKVTQGYLVVHAIYVCVCDDLSAFATMQALSCDSIAKNKTKHKT